MTLTQPELDRIAVAACDLVGVEGTGRRLVHHFSNAVYHLPQANAIARITTGDDSVSRIRLTVRVVEQLLEHGVPATPPLPGAGVVEVDGATVSFWQYLPQPEGRVLTASHLGTALKQLHKVEMPALELPSWTPLESLRAAIADDDVSRPLSSSERAWLADAVEKTVYDLGRLDYPLGIGVIHGDAWLGNLLWDAEDNAVLCDWDWTCFGPREVDLIPTWHATWRYGKDPVRPKAFAAAYGHDLEDWEGTATLLAMRDLVQITGPLRRAADSDRHARALRQRLDGIRDGSRDFWVSL